jgi:hypothetical protein
LRRIAGAVAEIAEVSGGACHAVVAIAGDRPGPVEMTAPRRGVAVLEILSASVRVGVVPERDHGARNAVEDASRRIVV